MAQQHIIFGPYSLLLFTNDDHECNKVFELRLLDTLKRNSAREAKECQRKVIYKSGMEMMGDCKSSGNLVTMVVIITKNTETHPIQFCL